MHHNAPQTPLLQEESATFLWYGPESPRLIGDFNQWDAGKSPVFEQTKPGQWATTLQFPPDAYIEYTFQISDQKITDPYNPRKIFNGMQGFNSYFYMPDGRPPAMLVARYPGRAGCLERQILEHPYYLLGGKRAVYLYSPPTTQPCPLLVVYDGVEFIRLAHLVKLVDRLIQAGQIRPIAMALVANAGQGRTVEYACNDATLGFLLDVLLPAAQNRLNLIPWRENPGTYGIMGASMGGLMALYTSLRLPHIFGKAISQSGAFWPHTVIAELVQTMETRPIQVWMDVGRFESLLELNQQAEDLLRSKGYSVRAHIYNGGHNYTAWRNDVGFGLEHLFGSQPA
jgi:enterochelin esterase-like enzyme